MDDTDKVDIGTQHVDEQEISTQTSNSNLEASLNYDMEIKLGILSNQMLHASYWFLVLVMMFTTKLQLRGLARSARQRERACRESAITIMIWIIKKGWRVKIADVAKPEYGDEEDFNDEYAMKTMAALDNWLEKGLRDVLEMVVGKEMDGMEEMLKGLLDKHREFHWDSQAMMNRVFSS